MICFIPWNKMQWCNCSYVLSTLCICKAIVSAHSCSFSFSLLCSLDFTVTRYFSKNAATNCTLRLSEHRINAFWFISSFWMWMPYVFCTFDIKKKRVDSSGVWHIKAVLESSKWPLFTLTTSSYHYYHHIICFMARDSSCPRMIDVNDSMSESKVCHRYSNTNYSGRKTGSMPVFMK